MAIPHAKPGEVIDVRPLGAALATTRTRTLVKTGALEVVRIVMAAGKDIAPHVAPGEVTVHCLEGKVEFRVGESTRELTAGTLLYLEGAAPHSLHASEDSSLLITILLTQKSATRDITERESGTSCPTASETPIEETTGEGARR